MVYRSTIHDIQYDWKDEESNKEHQQWKYLQFYLGQFHWEILLPRFDHWWKWMLLSNHRYIMMSIVQLLNSDRRTRNISVSIDIFDENRTNHNDKLTSILVDHVKFHFNKHWTTPIDHCHDWSMKFLQYDKCDSNPINLDLSHFNDIQLVVSVVNEKISIEFRLIVPIRDKYWRNWQIQKMNIDSTMVQNKSMSIDPSTNDN